MAAVSQPGARAGLITALVIFVVLFLVATGLFFTSNSANQVNEKRESELQAKYSKVINQTEMTDPDYSTIQDLQNSDPANRGRSVFDILKTQRDDLAKAITGQANTSAAKAMESAASTVQSANKTLEPAGT